MIPPAVCRLHSYLNIRKGHSHRFPISKEIDFSDIQVNACSDYVSWLPGLAIRVARFIPLAHSISVIGIAEWVISDA